MSATRGYTPMIFVIAIATYILLQIQLIIVIIADRRNLIALAQVHRLGKLLHPELVPEPAPPARALTVEL